MTTLTASPPNILCTSLHQIKSFKPCPAGWQNVLKANSQRSMEELFPLKNTVQSNSFSDVCWLLGKLGIISICVKTAQLCANSVSHLENYPAERAAAYAATIADAPAYAADDADAAAYAATIATATAYAVADDAYADADATYVQNLKNKAFLLLAIELYEQGVLS